MVKNEMGLRIVIKIDVGVSYFIAKVFIKDGLYTTR